MPHLDDGPKYPWGNEDWPGLKPDPGQDEKDWDKQVKYDGEKLKDIVGYLQNAHTALQVAARHLPKNIQAAEFGPPAGQQLAADGKQASERLQSGFTAFLGAWSDLINKVQKTKDKHYSTEDDNRHRVQQMNDWK
jgi:hypothetical protein